MYNERKNIKIVDRNFYYYDNDTKTLREKLGRLLITFLCSKKMVNNLDKECSKKKCNLLTTHYTLFLYVW